MQPYRPLPDQIAEQIAGRTIMVELDSWYLPDTATTSYRQTCEDLGGGGGHRPERRHAAVLPRTVVELDGEDYRGVFRSGAWLSDDVLPPYTELVRFDVRPPLRPASCVAAAATRLLRASRKRPNQPVQRFGEASNATRPTLTESGPTTTTPTRSRRSEWLDRRRVLALHASRLLPAANRRQARWTRSWTGRKAMSFRLARRRQFDRPWSSRWREGRDRGDCGPRRPDRSSAAHAMRRVRRDEHEIRELSTGWELAGTAPAASAGPSSLCDVDWAPASVPGTVAAAFPALGGRRARRRRLVVSHPL